MRYVQTNNYRADTNTTCLLSPQTFGNSSLLWGWTSLSLALSLPGMAARCFYPHLGGYKEAYLQESGENLFLTYFLKIFGKEQLPLYESLQTGCSAHPLSPGVPADVAEAAEALLAWGQTVASALREPPPQNLSRLWSGPCLSEIGKLKILVIKKEVISIMLEASSNCSSRVLESKFCVFNKVWINICYCG